MLTDDTGHWLYNSSPEPKRKDKESFKGTCKKLAQQS